MTLYPGASPDVVTSAITAPLERQFGQMSGLETGVDAERGRRIRYHASIPARAVAGRRRTGCAGRHQCGPAGLLPNDLPYPPTYSKVNPADPPIMTLAVTPPAPCR
ncbi:hypothetical protein MQE23_00115 [Streptomyces sp. HP-A2021]|nr:hypothetical protein MQE23_00115 [Streptomyces sp. HP-A2021]